MNLLYKKIRRNMWLLGIGVLVVALVGLQGVAASKLTPGAGPHVRGIWPALPFDTDWSLTAEPWSKKVAFARLLLQAGRPTDALNIFQEAWSNGDHPTWSRGRVAWYMGLAELRAGRRSNADEWFKTASQCAIPELDHCDPELLAYLGLKCHHAETQYTVAFQAPAKDLEQPSLQDVVKYLRIAQRDRDKSIKSRVRLATWLLLFGEMTATNPDMCLCSSSLDAFHEGFSLLDQLSKEFDADAKLARELETDPALTIRFDTAIVRQDISRQREQLARQEERARLNQLRQMCVSYKHTVEQFANAEIAFLLGDQEVVRQSHERVLQTIAATDKIVALRSDYFLFDDEPELSSDAEFSAGGLKPVAFSNQAISLVKSVHAFATYQQAQNAAAEVGSKLVDESRDWAEAALTNKAIGNLPSGADDSNLLATYVGAAAADLRGRQLAFDSTPEARQIAHAEFVKAREFIEKATAALKARPQVEASSELVSAVSKLALQLKSPQAAQAVIDEIIVNGEKSQAAGEFAEAAKRFFSPEFALQSIELRRQLGEPVAKLQSDLAHLQDIGLVNKDSSDHALVESRLIIQKLGAQLSKDGIPSNGSKEQKDLLARFVLLNQRLHVAVSNAKRPELVQQLNAQIALATAYEIAIEQRATSGDRRVQEAFRLAQDASAYFDGRLKDAGLRELDRTASIDSLIAARLAVGYLGIAVLPSYREEGLVSLAAAFDYSAAAQTTSTGIGLIGTPLLLGITRRDPSGLSQLAAEERERRQLMTRFVEAAITMELGEPAAAAEQMRQALSQGSSSSSTPALLRARDMAREADGFEAAGNLQTTIAAFRVFSDVKANNVAAALAAAFEMVDQKPVGSLGQRLARLNGAEAMKLVSSVESPIASVALALAAEAYAAKLPAEEPSSERGRILQLARLATSRSQELLKAPRLAQRYSHLVAISSSAQQRLSNAQHYLTAANEALKKGNYASSRRHAREGLARHPDENLLWATLLESEIMNCQAGELNQDDLSRVAKLTNYAFHRGVLTSFHRDYYLGLLEEQLGNRAKAIASFQSADANAVEARQRVLAKSKSARLRAIAGATE